MPDSSFFVHLQSLTDFANELETQLEALQKPNDHLSDLCDQKVQLGEFAEAESLRATHDQVVTEMTDLLGQVRDAIGFAQQVTGTVANDYQQADDSAASSTNILSVITDGIFSSGGGTWT